MSKRTTREKANRSIISVPATPVSNITTIFMVDRCNHFYSLDCNP